MTLSDILKEMQIQQGFREADLTPQVIGNRIPGAELARVDALAIAKRQAVDRIEELRNLYDKAIYSSSAVVFVVGDAAKRQAFAEAAAADDALAVSSDSFFQGIAGAAMARMSAARIINAAVSQEIVELVAQAIGKFAPGTFIAYPRMPSQFVDSIVRDPKEMLMIVKMTAKPTVEVPLSVTWLERNVANLAFAQKFTAEPLAVVVSVDDMEDFPAWQMYFLRNCPRVTVNVDEGTLEDQLKEAKEALSKAFGS